MNLVHIYAKLAVPLGKGERERNGEIIYEELLLTTIG